MNPFGNIYKGKRVLVTGHTGFKGSWLTTWLLNLGAKVLGYSLEPFTKPSNFEVLDLESKIEQVTGDIRDLNHLKETFRNFEPEIVFHLAAQAITRLSYDLPLDTFSTNLIGTLHILETIRQTRSTKAAVIITSDKCYQNVEWVWGYRENDRLGGDDPYSASKACAEIACNSYIKSFFSENSSCRISTVRAGNVIGGGDWALDRIIPDCVRAFSQKKVLEMRSPNATRPWQHVVEPLSGYLWVGAKLLQNDQGIHGESFNFGPTGEAKRTVEEVIREFMKTWGNGSFHVSDATQNVKKESNLLKLNCDKALHWLNWHAVLSFEDTMRMTAEWYKTFYNGEKNMYRFTIKQLEEYTGLAQERGLLWTK